MAGKARPKGDGRSVRRGTVLTGGSSAKVRKPSKREWTKKKEAQFLEVLAETCNVSLACREAKVSTTAAYRRRAARAGFRAAWREAIALAYRRLELVLLERSFNGTDKIVTRKDGSEERVREYPNQMALQLLKLHQSEATQEEREFSREEVDELRSKLLAKLERLRKREGIEEGQ